MPLPIRKRTSIEIDGSGYTSPDVTPPVALSAEASVIAADISVSGVAAYAVSVAGENNAVGTITLFDSSNDVAIAQYDVTLDADGYGGEASLPVVAADGASIKWSQEWDTSGDYTIVLMVAPPDLGG